jgi:hypothetical protein|tara:strand:+ start:9010 stop:9162 length:153 start_codon:yes stop_codon:yes gene_type:complete
MDEVSAHTSMDDFTEVIDTRFLTWDLTIANWEDIIMDFKVPITFTEVTIS